MFRKEDCVRPSERRLARRCTGFAGLLLAVATTAGCGGSPEDYTVGRAYWSVTAADFDGDGRIDIAGTFAGDGAPPHPGHVAVFLQSVTSPGHFLPAQVYSVGNDPFALTAGDFNGDGRVDLATDNEILATSGAGIDDVSVLLQSSTAPGEFLPAISCFGVYGDGTAAPVDPMCDTLNLPGDFSVNSVRTDLNGDSLVDQAIAYSGTVNPGCTAFDCHYIDTYVAVVLQNPAAPGTYLPPVHYLPLDGGFITWVEAADVDGDDRPDLVIGQSNGLYIRLQDASFPGQFLAAVLVAR
ncbi:VCBS repeat-containing protein [uncultured Piscinibacter sp.]|uniref:FG-GAP repeat domain-containing protein n=1 Tax=uncultured Piscinibacter sp. TaxID=1131835 RepID=UPI00260C24BF|nr:VCBS repeat-containing protein [uncultured Piscinibacter sp.]